MVVFVGDSSLHESRRCTDGDKTMSDTGASQESRVKTVVLREGRWGLDRRKDVQQDCCRWYRREPAAVYCTVSEFRQRGLPSPRENAIPRELHGILHL